MSDVYSSVAENFSLTRGGPFHHLLTLIGYAGSERKQVLHRAVIGTFLCWVRLLVLTFAQGLAVGTKVRIPFLLDHAVHLRFLMALPILILAETPIDRRWNILVREFLKSGLVGKDETASLKGSFNESLV
jgi:hypothetical protein